MNAKKNYALNRLKYYLSPFLIDFLRLMRSLPKLYKYRQILARNREWRNRYKNDAVLIVGNGPSLKGVDPEWIVGQKVIVMNNFFLALIIKTMVVVVVPGLQTHAVSPSLSTQAS